ncbi:DUF3857 domain-containing protein [Phyllobacterium salinisoli]|uniref:DUF3857 domain-containing protein n=1 Tax=Phyllobacterium salinisoli TaxID=1899321 RepID=A0A368JWU6_9HYPH|nr:DUF3857 and transglutaminase domain-containing protein [Phyllobacterium salinisoli]RCS21638.1 DUF3857 domain-containing protein [Phyllobacterium salinisoli]
MIIGAFMISNFLQTGHVTFWFSLLLSLILNPSSKAYAQDSPPIAKEETVSAYDTITVEADGRYIIEWETTRRLLDASGRDDLAKKTFSFNDQLSSLDVIEAETVKADGRRIKVQPDQIRLQEEPAAIGLPVFSTSKQKTIIFPDIEVGDSVHYRVRKIQREPNFPGHFEYTDSFSPEERVLSYKLILQAPRSLELRSAVRALKEVRTTAANGDKLWSWTFTQLDVRPLDYGKADVFVSSPHVLITSFPDWNTIAQAYRSRADDKVAITPEIQALADELTKGVSDRREQTKRIYNWVRGNVRYVALYLAQGSYVPHTSADILRNRYGDCKDHVVLLEALLRAKGIESHGALLATGNLFNLTSEATPSYFDHIITYVPEFDLYLDSTARYLPFGVKGSWLGAKPVLHVNGVAGIRTTPAISANDNELATTTIATINSDGSIQGNINEISTGGISIGRRYGIASVDPLQRPDIIQGLLAQNGLRGKGSFTADDPSNDDTKYRIDINFTTDKTVLDLSDIEAFSVAIPVQLGNSIADMTNFANERPDPFYARACAAVDVAENYEISVPDNVSIQSLPKPVLLAEGAIRYDATYTTEGSKIRVRRHYTMAIDRGYCTPQEIAGMSKTANKIRQDLQRKVLFAPIVNGGVKPGRWAE